MELLSSTIYLFIVLVSIAGGIFGFFYAILRIRRQRAVFRLDRSLAPLKTKYQAVAVEGQGANGRLQASLQLAYYRISGQVAYGWDDGSYTGVYELAESNGMRAGINMTVHMRILKRSCPHMYIDNKRNNSILKKNLPGKLKKARIGYLEGYVSDKFNIYAPPGYRIDGLVIAAPDVLDTIDQHNLGADIEILGNQLYMIFPGVVRLDRRLQEVMAAASQIAKAVDDNLSRYIDDRARGTRGQVAPAGKRLIRR